MAETLTYKILREHLVDGNLIAGEPIGIRIDQTLTQDATGTTAMLLFESMGLDRVKTELSVSYVDHNMAQFGPENHNDHLYLQSVAARMGVYHSRPGNGICHQVHLERFARPGATLLGSDSHTCTAGGIGSIAMGAGGLDVAVAMGGGAFYLTAPKVIGVRLTGSLSPWVSAKDVILKLLSILSTRGNVGSLVEYFGPGVASLPVPARATITNMGAELGVTTSVFPSDERTEAFLASQGRGDAFRPMAADEGAEYDRVIEIDLSSLESMCAAPSSPDHVKRIAELAGQPVHQVLIGSCTNSSYRDLMTVATVLKGRRVHPQVELGIAGGSRQVIAMLAEQGALEWLISAGARILELGCGPCIGQGQSPGEGRLSLRTFNRNFKGRSGTPEDQVFLVSPETAVAAALTGEMTVPGQLEQQLGIAWPGVAELASVPIDDGMIVPPLPENQAKEVTIERASTIVTPPSGDAPPESLAGTVLLHCGDKITTDHIMPAGSFLKYRSNVPVYAQVVFNCFNKEGQPSFAERGLAVKQQGRHGVIVAGDSYGQGSSREHAALCPMFLGVRLVIAKTIERIHAANLVNFAIVPALFENPNDYDGIEQGDELTVDEFRQAVGESDTVTIHNATKGNSFTCRLMLSPREREVLLAGGKLPFTRQQAQ